MRRIIKIIWLFVKTLSTKQGRDNLRVVIAINEAENQIRMIMPEHEANVIIDSYERTFDHQAYIDYLEMVHDKWTAGVYRNEVISYKDVVFRK